MENILWAFLLIIISISLFIYITLDIIALLIVGVICLVLFILWERYLENVQNHPKAVFSRWTPPPLMKLSIWGRAKGRFAVMMAIAFLNWSSFLRWDLSSHAHYYIGLYLMACSWTFWVQVGTILSFQRILLMVNIYAPAHSFTTKILSSCHLFLRWYVFCPCSLLASCAISSSPWSSVD